MTEQQIIEHTNVLAVTYRERTRLDDGTPTEMFCAECDAVWPIHRWYRWPLRLKLYRTRQPLGRWGVHIGPNRHGQHMTRQVWAWWHFRLLIGPDRYTGPQSSQHPWACLQCGARYVSAQRFVVLLGRQAAGPVAR